MQSIIHHIYASENLTSITQHSLALTDLQGIVQGIVRGTELTRSAKSAPHLLPWEGLPGAREWWGAPVCCGSRAGGSST